MVMENSVDAVSALGLLICQGPFCERLGVNVFFWSFVILSPFREVRKIKSGSLIWARWLKLACLAKKNPTIQAFSFFV